MLSKFERMDPDNKEEICHFYKLAAAEGIADAMIHYSPYFANNSSDLNEEDLYYCKMAADKGNVFALSHYAYILEGAKEVE